MPQNRRHFIKQLVTGTAALSASPMLFSCSKKQVNLTILHTNDVHSQIEPLGADHHKFPNGGGFAKRATIVSEIRKNAEQVLLLDCGDIFQGTPYFNFYKGKLEIELMNKMAYDAATIGNHEFDNGIEELARQVKNAKFPFVCSNYNFEDTPMKGLTLPFKTFDKGEIKVGVFGIGIELEGLVNSKAFGNTKYADPIQIANATAKVLKDKEKCDYVICLSHLGYRYRDNKVSDVVVAESSKDIDLILGGHTHTFMEEPAKVKNSDGREVLINQVGWGGVQLGRLDVTFSNQGTQATVLNRICHV